ncbi:RidA family protein, partial [Rhizobium leguminosarum]
MMGQAKVDENLLADAAYLPGQVANLKRGASVTAQTNEILERINDM